MIGRQQLTVRENQVRELLLIGNSNKELSDKLRITQRTAQFHASNVLRKVGVATRIELLARALALRR